MAIFREEVTSVLAGFHVGSLSWSNWNLEMLGFTEEGKPENLEKKCGARREPTTNSTHIWLVSTGLIVAWWATLGGECFYLCVIPAPQLQTFFHTWKNQASTT